MSQLERKWVADSAINSLKIDPTDNYTVTGLQVDSTNAVGKVGIGTTDPQDALHVRRADTSAGLILDLDDSVSGRAYRIVSDSNGAFKIIDVDDGGANRFQIGNTGTLTVSGDATFNSNFQINGTVTVVNTEVIIADQLEINQTDNLPALIVSQDTTGNTATVLKVENAGTGYALITDSGNVGIGTSSPGALLHVEGNILTSNGANIGNDTHRIDTIYMASTINYSSNLNFRYGSTTNVAIGTNGYVGIGTASPLKPLHVTGDFITNSNVGIGTTDPSSQLQISNYCILENPYSNLCHLSSNVYFDGANYRYINSDSASILRLAGNVFSFNTIPSGTAGGVASGTVSMYIGADGKVGIGTQNPSSLLHVYGTSVPYFLVSNASVSAIVQAYTSDVRIGALSAHNLGLYSSGLERMVINTSGKVGIGTTNPLGQLQINNYCVLENFSGNVCNLTNNIYYDGANYRYINSNSGSVQQFSGSDILFYRFPSGTAGNIATGSESLRITADGNVGIGTNNPLSLLHVYGSSAPYLRVSNASVSAFVQAYISDVRIGALTGHNLGLYANNAEKMVINTSGNVGIGSANPDLRCVISHSTDSATAVLRVTNINGGTSAATLMSFGHSTHGNGASIVKYDGNHATTPNQFDIINQHVASLNLSTAGTPRVTILGDGRVGIGTTNPSAANKVDVFGRVGGISSSFGEIILSLSNPGDGTHSTSSFGLGPKMVIIYATEGGNVSGFTGLYLFNSAYVSGSQTLSTVSTTSSASLTITPTPVYVSGGTFRLDIACSGFEYSHSLRVTLMAF